MQIDSNQSQGHPNVEQQDCANDDVPDLKSRRTAESTTCSDNVLATQCTTIKLNVHQAARLNSVLCPLGLSLDLREVVDSQQSLKENLR